MDREINIDELIVLSVLEANGILFRDEYFKPLSSS